MLLGSQLGLLQTHRAEASDRASVISATIKVSDSWPKRDRHPSVDAIIGMKAMISAMNHGQHPTGLHWQVLISLTSLLTTTGVMGFTLPTAAQLPPTNPTGQMAANPVCDGWPHAYEGRYQQALRCFTAQLTAAQATHQRYDEANALFSLGWVHANLGQYQTAVQFYQQALGIYRQLKTPLNQAFALGSMGWAYYYWGNYQQAIQFHQQALQLRRSLNY